MIACLAVAFLLFSLSTAWNFKLNIDARHDLEAGRVQQVHGKITDAQYVMMLNRTKLGKIQRFELQGDWFLSPLRSGCRIAIGDFVDVAFVPKDGARLTPLIVQMKMLYAC